VEPLTIDATGSGIALPWVGEVEAEFTVYPAGASAHAFRGRRRINSSSYSAM